METYKSYQRELEILPTILILEQYGIPYQQATDKLLIPKKFHSQVELLISRDTVQNDNFKFYARYESQALVDNMTGLLDQQQIPYQVIEQKTGIKEVHLMEQFVQYFTLNLRLKDFEQVRLLLQKEAEQQSIYQQDDYYLNKLDKQELIAILEKPDEWNVIDVEGARVLLNNRGHKYSHEEVEVMRLRRLITLSKAKSIKSTTLILGYTLALSGGILGIFWAFHYGRDKTTLPNGQTIFTYDYKTRVQTQTVLLLSLVVLIIILCIVAIRGMGII